MSIRLRLLQRPSLQLSTAAEVSLGSKDAILLAILAIDGPTPRERLSAWLWPDATPGQARTNLRQRLFRLRKLVGSEIVSTGAMLCLSLHVRLDLTEAEQALLDDPYAAEGELLGVHEYLDCHDLDQWLRRARANWRARVQETLTARVAQLDAEGRLDVALAYARRLARDEPLHEHAQRTLMKALLRRGDRSAALQVYEQMRQALKDELGVSPSLQSESLRACIEAPDPKESPIAAIFVPEEPERLLAQVPCPGAYRLQQRHRDALDQAAAEGELTLSPDRADQWEKRLYARSRVDQAELPYRVRRKVNRLLLEAQSLVDASARIKGVRTKTKKKKSTP